MKRYTHRRWHVSHAHTVERNGQYYRAAHTTRSFAAYLLACAGMHCRFGDVEKARSAVNAARLVRLGNVPELGLRTLV